MLQWTLKGSGYALPLLPLITGLPNKTYSPLERSDPRTTAGSYSGVAGFIQILRYTETPVGPYDEFVLIPGAFTYDREGLPKTNIRVSRMYVSQKYTNWNGRVSKYFTWRLHYTLHELTPDSRLEYSETSCAV